MLTNAAVKAAEPSARLYKLHDSGGLHLLVRPSGSKSFQMKFRWKGKEQLLTIGAWPDVSLTDARIRRDRARDQLDRNVDPRSGGMNNMHSSDANTFEQLARRWFERRRGRWSPEHAEDVLASLERDVFPAIGAKDPASIDATEVLDILLAVEERGCIETARRLRERISGVFRFGIPLKACKVDPAAAIADELSPRPVQRPQPALTDLTQGVKLMADVDALDAPIVAKLASRFLALTAPRMKTLRFAERSEIEGVDWNQPDPTETRPLWRIPPEHMKLTKVKKADPSAEHVIPLSRQAIDVLLQLYQVTGPTELLFPGRRRGRPIGEGAIGDLYDSAGYAGRHVPHGWRATFSTILNGRYPDDQALIDQALAHVGKKGKVEAAYNRAKHLERLRDLFQRWADLIDPKG
jgi:integrase